MTQFSDDFLDEVLQLPVIERGQLAARLIESLDAPHDGDAEQAWEAEIERRLASLNAGQVKLVPSKEALKVIRGSGNDHPN